MAPGKKSQHPRKRFYRARAHSNPLSDSQFPVPLSPAHIDWSLHFPAFFKPPPEAEADATFGKHLPHTSSVHVGDGQEEYPASAEAGDGGTGIFENSLPHGESPLPVLKGEKDPLSDLKGVDGEEAFFKDPSSVLEASDAPQGQPLVATNADHSHEEPKVRFADIGCGFGGLLVKLSPLFPTTLMVGMELRDKVSEYVKERIIALRKENPGQYQNISIIRTNAMKYLQNYFQKGQLQKMFFLFPDPHFKERNHRRRVISVALLAEYAHVMALGGILYTITDVEELGEWMKSCLDAHPLFEEVSLQEQELDPVVNLLRVATEEGQKVERNSGDTFHSVYRRVLPASDGA